jgi:hypothetical protein
MPTDRPEFVDQNLKCLLSDVQKIRTAEALARSLQERETLEEEKKAQAHELAERMDGINKSIKKGSITLQNGYEYRWISCKVLYNDPKPGEKTLVRMDTGEVVRVEDMSFAECQETLPLAKPEPDAPAPDPNEVAAVETALFPERLAGSDAPESIAAAGPDPLASEIAEASQKPAKRKTKRSRKVLPIAGNGKGSQPHA